MRFLIAFAIIGYASAGLINAGDLQAAQIDANVASQDAARALNEAQARAIEAAREVAGTNHDILLKAHWNGVDASQKYVAAIQTQVDALNKARSAYLASPYATVPYALTNPYLAGRLGYAGIYAW